MMKRNILIIGATSAIAEQVARRYAESGCQLFLVGRNRSRLECIADDLQVRSRLTVAYEALDLTCVESHADLLKKAQVALGDIDIVLIAHGSLPNQKKCEASFFDTQKELNSNFLSVVSLLTMFANYFEQRKKGYIAVITSVAGDRGRQSNYIYGTAKGALTIFLQGLRNRLAASHVTVLTIKPGFVNTPMTKEFKKGLLWSSPEFVAKKIVEAIAKKRSVIYVPFYWQYIMGVIKAIPEKIFCRLSL